MPPQPRKSTTAKTGAKKTTAKKTTAKKTTAGRKSATAGPTAGKPTGPSGGRGSARSAGAGAAASATSKAAGARAAASEGVEEAIERIRALQERLLQATKHNGEAYLDAYEKNLASMLAMTEKAAKSTNLDWAVALAANYADFVKRINAAVIKASRSALR